MKSLRVPIHPPVPLPRVLDPSPGLVASLLVLSTAATSCTSSKTDDSPTPNLGCENISAVFERNGCANSDCHGVGFQAGVDLVTDGIGERLVGQPSITTACGGELLVDPDDRDNSLVLRLIDAERFESSDSCGVMMPLGSMGVSADDVACLEAWIDELIATIQPPTPAEIPFEPATADSYLAKVKTLVTGRPVTDAERGAVATSGPAVLGDLLDQWMSSPAFERKMKTFFAVALQQRVQGLIGLQFRTRDVGPLADNAEESFLRTAWDIVDRGRPFTEIATTRRWAVTTALLAGLRFTDVSEGTRDVRLGTVRFEPGDYEDWRFVELVRAGPEEPLIDFDDLPALREVQSRIAIELPRVGFFSTPAFFANAPTNDDNQFRVTLNQALIGALGEDFSVGDATPQANTDGLDEEHSAPDSSCFGCHRLIDPMRLYFMNEYGIFYQKRQRAPGMGNPSFAFLGQEAAGSTLDDFGAALASHPRFAAAWVQKLCYYANSQPCDPNDPEFLRVTEVFRASGHDFKTLIRSLFSSPLVTGSEATQTYADRPFIVSITRQNHLCALLDERLDTDDVCAEVGIRDVIGLIPDDEFSRSKVPPLQTAVSGAFHFAGADQVCTRLAARVVTDTTDTPFSTSSPEAALDAMVQSLMGLSPTHPRHDSSRSIIAQHYTTARSDAPALVALRSAFVLACLSPDVMALGL